ncbi:hypothetical protein D3C75_321980 [compost metagenome]
MAFGGVSGIAKDPHQRHALAGIAAARNTGLIIPLVAVATVQQLAQRGRHVAIFGEGPAPAGQRRAVVDVGDGLFEPHDLIAKQRGAAMRLGAAAAAVNRGSGGAGFVTVSIVFHQPRAQQGGFTEEVGRRNKAQLRRPV